MTHPVRRLTRIEAPATGPVVDAPPVLIASNHTIDYQCGNCETVLLHAEEGQVKNLVIRCRECGTYNRADT